MSPFEFSGSMETVPSSAEEVLRAQKEILLNFTEADPRIGELHSEQETADLIEHDSRIEHYLKNFNITTIRSARSVIEQDGHELSESQAAELQRLQNLIATLVGRYTQEARITFNISLQMEQMLLDRDKGLERLDQHNRERGRFHEELNAALKEYNRLLRGLESKGFIVPQELLSPAEIRFESNRDPQREALGVWAVETDYYLRAQHILQRIKEQRAHDERAGDEV